ncbi:hypothetical protein D0T87_04915 [Bacteroides sp. 51]|nr:hypothetical protein [Bacteroides sp. 51]
MQGIEKLIAAAWITACVLITPVLFIIFDLWAGIRKAIERGEKITSNGLRRTFAKIAKYYNVLLALLVIDAIQMAGFWYVDTYYEHNFPVFPFIVLIGAIGVGIIEVKSIYEKADEKTKRQTSDVALLAGELAKHKSDPAELAKAVAEYLNKDKEEKK